MAEYNDKSKITKAIPAEEDNIELVIKLPKEIYVASRMLNVKPDDVVQIPLEVIANGTPLPKGHGVLKDADVMINKLCTHEANELFGGITCAEILDFINDEKTIIEADKVERTNEEQVLNGFYEMMKGLWGNQDLKMPNSVSERPPADVVERSKIDKAIEEIENAKMYRGNTKGLPNDIELDRYFDKGLMKSLEIFKRNIGE